MNRMTKPSKKGGPLDAFDWSKADAIVQRIPRGRWASYGAVAVAAELPRSYAKAFGHHPADADLDGVWRVLSADGRPSPRFRLEERQSSGDIAEVISWLKEEGVRFDHKDRARNHCQLDVRQLRRLITP